MAHYSIEECGCGVCRMALERIGDEELEAWRQARKEQEERTCRACGQKFTTNRATFYLHCPACR